MCRAFHALKNKKGIVLVYTALFLTAALGITALAVDLGYIYVISNDLKSVADSGALTAAAAFLSAIREATDDGADLTSAPVIAGIMEKTKNTSEAIIQRSDVVSNAADITINLEYGDYDTDSSSPYNERTGTPFTDHTAELTAGTLLLRDISAFRVTVGRTGTNGSTLVPTFFANIFGIPSLSLTRNSVSMFAPRNFMMVIDSSGSMDDITYPRTTTIGTDGRVLPPVTVWPPEESFISRPSDNPAFPILYSLRAPAPNPPLFPEPLQTVLGASLGFLNGLITQTDLGDKAGVYYFAKHASSKVSGSMIPVSQDNIDNIFEPLLSNAELYQHLVLGTVPSLLSNGSQVTTPHYVYNGTSVYDPAVEQYDGQIAIPQGNTNIGDAILNAANGINSSATSSKSISIIVLFTDGMPDCAPVSVGGPVECFNTGATSAQLEAARNYTLEQAQLAIDQNIRIYPITFGNFGAKDGDAASQAEAAKAQLLFDTIAQLSGLPQHSHIEDTTDVAAIQASLDEIFDEISLFVPFSLVG